MLISPLNAFPWVLNGLMEAWVSLKRLQAFLTLPELDLDRYYLKQGLYCSLLPQSGPRSGDEAVCIADGCFTWRRGEEEGGAETQGEEGREETTAVEWLLDGIKITVKKVCLYNIVVCERVWFTG